MQEKERSACFKRMEGIAVLTFKEATEISLRLVMGYSPAGRSPTTQCTSFKISKAEVAMYLLIKKIVMEII